MIPSSIDPGENPPRPAMTALGYGVALIALGFALSTAWYIVARLNIGLDVSDSAYYIISYAQHRDIESQPTLAGWLWASMSPFHGVLANRYLGVLFIVACFTLLAMEAWRTSADRWVGATTAWGFTAAGSLVFYAPWLPDPSYNSINLGFIALGWAGLFGLLHATSEKAVIWPREIVWALVIGVAVASTFLTKPTSAALLGLALLISYLAIAWRHLSFRRILILASATLFGLVLPLLALSSIGETPERVYTTLKNGVDAAFKITKPSLNPLQSLATYMGSTFSAPLFKRWFTWVAIIIVATVSADAMSRRPRLTPLARVCLDVVATVGFTLLAWQTGLLEWSDNETNGLLFLMLALAIGGIVLAEPNRRRPLCLVVGAMTISPVIYVFGTGTAWISLIPTASGFTCAALGIVVSSLPTPTRFLVAIPALGLLTTMLGSAANGIEWRPYRISPPLSAQHSRAEIGPRNEAFLESPTQATFYNRLASVRPIVERLSERPYLIDLSGRVPIVAFQIGARVPRTPWLLSGYPGSTKLFHEIVGKIPREQLQRAWVFQADGYKERFPNDILQAYGLNFPADYVALTTVPIQYLGVEGTLYAPAAAMKDTVPEKPTR